LLAAHVFEEPGWIVSAGMETLAERLAARTLELVDIASESRHEEKIRAHLLELVPAALGLEYEGDEAFFFLSERRTGTPLVVLAGHYDTVPSQGNLPGSIADGTVHGLGASDMKGGLAVAVELARDLARDQPGLFDIGLLLFGREELPVEHDPLPALFGGCDAIHETSLAIVLEPTDGYIQAGCLGNLIGKLVFHGTSGHSARPWLADNAIERAVEGLRPLASLPRREVLVRDLTFVESISVTRLEAGIADNVIPDRAVATLSFRYAPDRTPEGAEVYLRSLVPEGATLEIESNARSGRVVTDSPLGDALLAAGAFGIQPKQAWTNVADFTANGIDAVNFGPGHTAFAHRKDEQVAISALVHAYETLRRFLTTPIRDDSP
jgi:succinyl-diaminopimelate desuccinylase